MGVFAFVLIAMYWILTNQLITCSSAKVFPSLPEELATLTKIGLRQSGKSPGPPFPGMDSIQNIQGRYSDFVS